MRLPASVLPLFLLLVIFSTFAAARPISGYVTWVTMIPWPGPGGSSSASGIAGSLCQIKYMLTTIIPTIALIMFLMAGLVYAAGQAFGAEMKAKAQGWAMSLLVGAIIGLLLAVLAPTFLSIFGGPGGLGTACP